MRASIARKCLFLAFLFAPHAVRAQSSPEACPRPRPGAEVPEPEDLRSRDGVLSVDLTFRNFRDPSGRMRYCYLSTSGAISPNLRVHPGDLLILRLKNDLHLPDATPKSAAPPHAHGSASRSEDPCDGGEMTASATNLHFHGLAIPSACHQDEVLKITIAAGSKPFEYKFRIPTDQPPGLYWYHPHLHGFTKNQVAGGASGALIVEGIESADHQVAGLPERVLMIRDEDLLHPDAAPSAAGGGTIPPVVLDRDGDARNTGTGTGKPARDLSLNFISAPYPDYPTPTIKMKPSEKQLWRVVNASSITYLNLQILFKGLPQQVGIVGVDGVPINRNGLGGGDVIYQDHLGISPGGRVEFIINGPPLGSPATLVTRSVNTGPGGENDPVRPIATLVAAADAPEPRSALAVSPAPAPPVDLPWIGKVQPIRTRKLYFSEKLQDPKDPNSPTTFYLTVEGQEPKPFDPASTVPNLVVHQGDVEDWIVENRSTELHDFHIHQIHFLLLEWFGIPINEPFLRDTINVPFWDGKSPQFPTVRLRMDFRAANVVGTFPYHCHLLEHEDGGMMGLIQVEPKRP
jgi:FtsP/CotA-like multicopper oxidase with cupredoxin domain